MDKIELPISKTGKKYGYITWRKKDDPKVHALFGEREHIKLRVGSTKATQKRIDWKKRRIGITYTITRDLSPNADTYILSKSTNGGFRLSFA
jgi:hypothetical protein